MLLQNSPRLVKYAHLDRLSKAGTHMKSMLCLFVVLCSGNVIAAENILLPGDLNSRITVENAVVKGSETTVFFFTWPDRGDPNAGKPCPLNFYSVDLKPGLPAVRADIVAKGVCSGILAKGRLLDKGDALMIVRDRLERWRDGKNISSQPFSSFDSVSTLRVTTADMGAQSYDISSNGDVLLAVPVGGTFVVTSLKTDGSQRWEVNSKKQGVSYTVEQVLAGADGEALLYMGSLASGLSSAAEAQLHVVAEDGSRALITLNETEELMDVQNMANLTQEDMQKFFEQQRQSKPESIEKLKATAREDGGFDVLFYRKGGVAGREGHFLYRLGPDGSLQNEISLGDHIVMHGLENWFDYYIEGNQLVLLSKAPVTQKIVRKVKKKWGQNIVSWIDLGSGIPTSRLIPLDERYIEAAMNAGDEGLQYLDGLPGGEPELLTKLGDKPLVVSVGWISRRQALRLNEADDQLVVFTEVIDERQASLAKEESRKQRNVEREARTQRMQADQAAAAGMSEEEFNALSKKEQKAAIIRNGGMDKLMESMMHEAQIAQTRQEPSAQNMPQQQAGIPQGMTAQIAAAMTQAQEEMANNPNMTPEMRAQMATIMAQMGQGTGGQAAVPSTMSAIQPKAVLGHSSDDAKVLPGNVLKVDAVKRGFIEYENKDGRLVTLLIFNRQTGAELLKKDYPDGVIYEYVDFSQFKLPLEQIGVIYREVAGIILKDLTPVIVH